MSFSQLKRDEYSNCMYVEPRDKSHCDLSNCMNENDYDELKYDIKRITNLYKPLNEAEFLSKTYSEIRQEFRKLPNPPAKDTHAAR